jgi:hypothetical protein
MRAQIRRTLPAQFSREAQASLTYYRCYGMTLATPFRCPSLREVDPVAAPDVAVRLGPVPDTLPGWQLKEPDWELAPGRFLVHGRPGSGRFLVDGADRVNFEPGPDLDPATTAVVFVATVLPAILRHQGLLVLHGTAVETPGGTVVLCGQSGAGKSTTAGALLARGDALVSDDVTALTYGRGGVEVLPGVPQVHLDVDSANRLGLDLTDAPLQPWRRMKAAITASRTVHRPVPLRSLVVLEPVDDPSAVVAAQVLDGAGAFAAVQSNLYGPAPAAHHEELFPLLSAIVEQARVVAVRRPRGRWTTAQVVVAIDQAVNF